MKKAYVTVLSTNNYYKGVLVLFESLKLTNPVIKDFVIIVNETIDKEIIDDLTNRGYIVIKKDKIEASFIKNDKYAHWSNTFDKFNVFDLLDYDKVVYLDSDMYVDKNIDELFDLPNMSATIAAKHYYPDWTNLNSGLMVITPKEGVLEKLKEILYSGKFESHIGDQDIIGNYFDWENQNLEIIDKYNIFSYLIDNYINDGIYTLDDLKVIHYIGNKKPWMFNSEEIEEYKNKIKNNRNESLFFEKYLDLLKKL